MEFSAKQIAEFLKGTVIGNPEVLVTSLSKIEEGQPGTLSFLSNPKYTHYIYTTQASVVLVNKDFEPEKELQTTIIKVEDAYQSLALLLNMVEQSKPKKRGIHSLAFISPSATIGENVYIAPFVFIGENAVVGDNTQIYPHTFIGDNVKIGHNTKLYAGIKVYENCTIGNNCILHAGVVIGSDGFGFAPEKDGSYKKIPQIGNVIVEDDVEIGANSTLDSATMGSSILHKGVKIDNLVHLAHNVEVGNNTAMAAQCGVSGSTKIGKNCVFAGQVGLAGHITIADGTILGAQSGVASSVKKPNEIFLGSPIMPVVRTRKVYAITRSLPEMHATIIELQKEIKNLKETIKNL
jgi:UDP-3-O-[3-hydroxymyristoyl] glucosamine N-acyltransferase